MTSIIVDSIRLRNFGAVKEATLRPLHNGLTGISGVSGAGKSTFLKGMRFALFNDVPKNIKIANLRRIGSDYKTDECSVSVVFLHAGQKVEVIRELVGKNNQNIPAIYVDGIEQVHTSSSTAEAWVKKRLGMDAKDFTTATVIPQKQLDELVDDTPSVRRARIEKLAGIESMSLALKSARDEENAVKAQVTAMPGSQDIVDELNDEVESFVALLNEDTEKDVSIAGYLENIESEYVSLTSQQEVLTAQYSLYRKKSETVASLTTSLANVSDNKEMVESQLDRAVERFHAGTESNAEQLATELQGYEKQLNELGQKSQEYRVALGSVENRLSYQNELLAEKTKKLATAQAKVTSLESNLTPVDEDIVTNANNDITRLQDNLSMLAARKNQLLNEWKEVSDSVKVLSGTHDAQCPTCHSHLADPSGLINSLKTTMVRIKDDGEAINGQVILLEKELSQAKNTVTGFTAQKQRYEQQLSTIAFERSVILDYEAQIKETKRNLAGINEEHDNLELFDIESINESLQAVSESKNDALRRLEAVKHTEQAKADKEALEAQLAVLTQKHHEATVAMETAQQELDAVDAVDETLLEETQQRVTQLTDLIRKNRNLRNDLAMSISNSKIRLEGSRKSLDKETALVSSKVKLLNDLEHKSAVSDVLDEFRKSSIAKIAPELADSATELISAMTNGKFVQIDLDSEFTPSILNSDGHTLTIHQLSGGELSVVALALRIAIGTLISGGTGGMLWLDEVLSAQDVNRRHAILSAIRALPVNQIVMINHTAEADDVVDKVVQMTYSEGDGSYIDSVDDSVDTEPIEDIDAETINDVSDQDVETSNDAVTQQELTGTPF